MKSLALVFGLLLLFAAACNKESYITDASASLSSSADSLSFDTVFTSTGSVTRFFKIFNDNNQKLRISRVQLAGGANSPFRMNVDGISGTNVSDLELEANDSTYVFVTVSINPDASNLPFIVEDSILIHFNGNERKVKLSAWGQNAHFLKNQVIETNTVWTNDKPYVILGGIQVDTNITLRIEKGCRVYFHADAPLIVDGTLEVAGAYWDSTRVVFQSDRLDDPYRNYPASWPGIYFRAGSKNNHLQYAIIKNAYQGLVSEEPSLTAQPKLLLQDCIVDNCYDAGIVGIRTEIVAENCLVSNCGKNIVLAFGGKYSFNHITSAAFSNTLILHKEPALLVTDFIKENNIIYTADLDAEFRNSIFWGDNGTVDDEVVSSKIGNTNYSARFYNCLWKVKAEPDNTLSSNMVVNEYPAFDSVNTSRNYYNFRLKDNSPALEKGISSSILHDLDGKPRPVGLPDIGCYERQ